MTSLAELQEKEYRLLEQLLVVKQMQEQQHPQTTTQDSNNAIQHASNAQPSDVQTIETTSPAVTAMAIIGPSTSSSHQQQQQQQQVDSSSAEALPHASIPRQPSSGIVATPRTTPLRQRGDSVANVTGHDTQRTGDDGQHQERDHEGSHVRAGSAEPTPSARSNVHATPARQSSSALVGMGSLVPESGGAHGLIVLASPEHNESRMMIVRDGLEDRVLETPPHFPHVAEAVGSVVAALQDDRDAQEQRLQEAWAEVEAQKDRVGAERAAVAEERVRLAGRLYKGKHRLGLRALKWPLQEVPPDCSPNSEPFSDHSSDRLSASSSDVSSGGHEVDRAGPVVQNAPAVLEAAEPQAQQQGESDDVSTALQTFEGEASGEDRGALQTVDQPHSAETEWHVLGKAMGRLVNDLDTARTTQDDEVRAAWADLSATREEEVLQQRQQVAEERLAVVRAAWAAGDPEALDAMCWPMDEIPPSPPARKKKKDAETVADESVTGGRKLSGLAEEQGPVEPPLMAPETTTNDMEQSVGSQGVDPPPADRAQQVRRGPGLPLSPSEDLSLRPVVDDDDATPPPEPRPEIPHASSTPPAEEEHHIDRDVRRSAPISQYSRPITSNDDDDDDGDVVLPPQHVRSVVRASSIHGSDLADQQRALSNNDVRDPTVKYEGEVIDLAARSPSAVSSAGFHSAVSEVDPLPPHEDSVAPTAVMPSMDAMGGSVHSSAAPLHAHARNVQQGQQQGSRSDSPSHGGASSSPVSSTSTDVTSTDASAPQFGGSQQQSHHHRSVSQHSDDPHRLAQRLGGGGDATEVVAASSAAVSERAEFGTPVSDQPAAGPLLIDAGSGVAGFGASGGRSTPPRVRQDPMCLEQQLSGFTRFDDPWRAELPSAEIPSHVHEHQRPQETSPTPQLVSASAAAAPASSTEDGIGPGQAEGTGWGMMDTSVGTGKQSISTSRNSSRHSTRHSTPTSLSDAHLHRSAVGGAPAVRGSSLASSQSGRSAVHVAPTSVANAGVASGCHGAAGINPSSSATSVASRTSSAVATPPSRPPIVPPSATTTATPERWTPPPVAQYERPNRLPDAWRSSPGVAGPTTSVNAHEHQYSSSAVPAAGHSASQLPQEDAELLRTRDELFPHGISGGPSTRPGEAEPEQHGYTARTALTPSVATLHGSRGLAASAPPVLADGRLSRSPFRARSPLSASRFHGAQLNDGGQNAPTSSVETGKEGKKEPRSPGRVSPRRSQPIGPGHAHGTVLGNPYLESRPGYAETHAARLTAPLSTVEASTTGARAMKTSAGEMQQRPPHVASVAPVAPGAPAVEEKVAATPAAHDHPYMQQTPLPPYRPLPHRQVMTPDAGDMTLSQSQPLTGTTVAPQQHEAAQRRAIQRSAVTPAYPQTSSPPPTAPQGGQTSSVSPSKPKPQSPFSSPLKSQRFAGPSIGAQNHHRSPNYESPSRYLDSSSREPIESGVMADPLPLHRYYSPDQMEKERLRRQRFIAATTAAAQHDQQQQQQEQKAPYHQQDGSSNRTLSPQQSSERRKFGVGHYYQSPPQQRQQGHAPDQGVQQQQHRTPERSGSERRPRYSDRLPYSPSSGVTLRAPKASSLSPRGGGGGGVSAVVASPTGPALSPGSVATGVDRPAAAARAASQSPPRPMRRTSPSPGPPSQDPVVQAQEQLARRGFRVPMPRSPTSRSDPGGDFPQDGNPSTTPSAATAPRQSSTMKTGGQRRAVEATEQVKRAVQVTTTPRTSSAARSHSDRRSRRPVSPSATTDSFGRTKQGFREMLLQQRALLRQREQERHAVESHDCSTGSDDIDQSAYVGDITPPHRQHHHRDGRSLDSSLMTSPQRSPSEEKGTQTPPHRDHRHHSARDENRRDVQERAQPAKTDQTRDRQRNHDGTVSTLGYTSSDTSASSVTNGGDTRRSKHGGGKGDAVSGQRRVKDNNGPRENSDKDSRGADGNFRPRPEQQQRLQSSKQPAAASSDRVGQAKRPYQRLVSAQQQQQQQQQQQRQQRPDLTKRHEEEVLRRDDGESHQQRIPTEEVDSPALSAAAASTGQRRLFPNPQRPYHTLIDGTNSGQTRRGRDDAVDPRRTNTSESDVRSHDSVDAPRDGNVHNEALFDRSADRESDGSDSPAVIARKAAELLRRKRAEREVREFTVRAKLDQFTAEYERDAHDNGQEGRRHIQRDQPRPSERPQAERMQSGGYKKTQQQQQSSRQQDREKYGRSTSADSDAASVSSSVASTQPPSSISSDSAYLSSVRSDRHPHAHTRNDVARSGAPGSGSGAGVVNYGGGQRPGSRSNNNGYARMYDAAAKRSIAGATAAQAAQQQQQQQQLLTAPTSTKYNNGGRSIPTASTPTVNALRSSSVGSIGSVVSSALTARAQVNAAPVSPPWIVVWSGVNKTEAQGCRIVMTRPIPWHMVLAKAAGLVKCQPAPQALYTPDGRRVSCLEDLVGGSDYLVLPSGCKYREESVPTRLLERIISGASSVAEY